MKNLPLKKFLIAIIIIAAFQCTADNEIVWDPISGTIIDTDQKPVANILISTRMANAPAKDSAKTMADGKYFIQNGCPNRYSEQQSSCSENQSSTYSRTEEFILTLTHPNYDTTTVLFSNNNSEIKTDHYFLIDTLLRGEKGAVRALPTIIMKQKSK